MVSWINLSLELIHREFLIKNDVIVKFKFLFRILLIEINRKMCSKL